MWKMSAAAAIAVIGVVGCAASQGDPAAQDGQTGEVTMFVTTVPADGTCLRITVVGTRTVVRTFDLPAGQSSTVTLGGLPLGTDTFTDEAFAGACSAVTSSSIPTWVSDPATAFVQSGVVTNLTLVLHRSGQANVTSDFQDDPTSCVGAPCMTASDCCTGTACVSGVCSANICPAGQQLCSNVCTDTSSSLTNCGACGLVCGPVPNGTSLCTNGMCTAGACFPGFANCNMSGSDGCETNVLSDANNCGGCGMVCQGGTSACVNGACVATCDPATSVAFGGHCYYLDGSGGACDPGYQLASQSILNAIAPLFAGKNYKHMVSTNCCIYNADLVENWGMTTHCNQPGPFSSGEPMLGGAGCTNATVLNPGQLTLCGTP